MLRICIMVSVLAIFPMTVFGSWFGDVTPTPVQETPIKQKVVPAVKIKKVASNTFSYADQRKAYKEIVELRTKAQDLAETEEYEKASALYKEILSRLNKTPGKLHDFTLEILKEYVDFQYARGKLNEGRGLAIELASRLKKKMSMMSGKSEDKYFSMHLMLSDYIDTTIRLDQLEKAYKSCNEALNLLKKEYFDSNSVDDQSFDSTENNIASYYKAKGIEGRSGPLWKNFYSLKGSYHSFMTVARELHRECTEITATGNFKDAYTLAQDALMYAEKAWSRDSFLLGLYLRKSAICAEKVGETDVAQSLFERAVKVVCDSESQATSYSRTTALDDLATFYLKNDMPAEVENLLKQSIAIHENRKLFGFDGVRLGMKYHILGKLYMDGNRNIDAVYYLDKALATHDLFYDGEESFRTESVMKDLIAVYKANGKDEDAANIQRRLDDVH